MMEDRIFGKQNLLEYANNAEDLLKHGLAIAQESTREKLHYSAAIIWSVLLESSQLKIPGIFIG